MSAMDPIPVRLHEEFRAFMAANENDDLPDGAWFQCLDDAAQQFIDQHRLRGACSKSAAHQYLRMPRKAAA